MTKEQKDLELSSNWKIKEKDLDCKNHGPQKAKILFFSGKWTTARCTKCDEERKEQQIGRENLVAKQKAEQAKIEQIVNNIGRAMIPQRFRDHSFDTFIATTDEQKAKKEYCFNYADNFDKIKESGQSIIFTGKTGTGKTHLACSIANHIINSGGTAVFLSVIKAIRQVKDTYNRSSERTEQQAINWFVKPDLLILDEVGVQFGSEAEKIILFEILNERYENMKPTILISNLNASALKEFIGERITDRMKENGGSIVKFEWESKRNTKN